MRKWIYHSLFFIALLAKKGRERGLYERSKDLRDENPVRDGKMLSLH